MIGKKIKLKKNSDERGMLMAINCIPFEAKRMFFIFDVEKGSVRGNHFSRTSSFIYVVLRGACKVQLDDGAQVEEYELLHGEGLQFSPNTWMILSDFQNDTILCVLSDTEYSSCDYVSDYGEFKRTVRLENV